MRKNRSPRRSAPRHPITMESTAKPPDPIPRALASALLSRSRTHGCSVQKTLFPGSDLHVTLWLCECLVRGNVLIYRVQKAIQGDDFRPRRRSWTRSPRTRSYPELLRVMGPLLSLVFRTEDVCQRYNQCTETFRVSQSGFPLLTPTMQSGQDCYECGTRRSP